MRCAAARREANMSLYTRRPSLAFPFVPSPHPPHLRDDWCVFIAARARTPNSGDEHNASPPPDIPSGAMVTCSADNTVRIWDLGPLDGKVSGDSEGHSGRSLFMLGVCCVCPRFVCVFLVCAYVSVLFYFCFHVLCMYFT